MVVGCERWRGGHPARVSAHAVGASRWGCCSYILDERVSSVDCRTEKVRMEGSDNKFYMSLFWGFVGGAGGGGDTRRGAELNPRRM